MRRGVHEHLPFGEGEVDLPAVLAALSDIGYGGLVARRAAPPLARRPGPGRAQPPGFLRDAAADAHRLTRRS